MSTRLRFLDAAKAELADAIAWYEPREVGLGNGLLDDVEAGLESIERDPTRFAVDESYGGRVVRSHMLGRFPYRLIFECRMDDVIILAVAHHRRRPGYWRKRKEVDEQTDAS